ncbi:MAG: molybdate ABC transporter substrate-binding protein [Acidobacteriota bacterium]|nr:molybdate ABC transporter substrate-binding protein [Acidobacteriota bacterium]
MSQINLTVAAAADLSPLEPDLAGSFGKIEPNTHLRFVTESSAALTQQIENGAPYDVFLSANAQFVDRLAANSKIPASSVRTYAEGRLGLLWRDGKHHPLQDLSADRVHFLALPNPKLAPYGVAARQTLEHEHLWDSVQPKVVYGENVRQALQLFTSGNADAVLTSASLLTGKDPQLVPANSHQPILQKAGIVGGTKNLDAASAFLDFLTSPAGQAVFAKYGFSPPR